MVNCMVDYFKDGKIIEFFGNYWHANPSMYDKHATIRKQSCAAPAQDIWNAACRRLAALKNCGYEILVIWESKFTQNPKATIDKCRRFISD